MLIAERRRRILEQVTPRGYARSGSSPTALGISESTVRRDLRSMVADGLLTPTRGGVGRPGHAAGRRAGPAGPRAGRRADGSGDPVAGGPRGDRRPRGRAGRAGQRGAARARPDHHRAGPAARRDRAS